MCIRDRPIPNKKAYIESFFQNVMRSVSTLMSKKLVPSWLDLEHDNKMNIISNLFSALDESAFLLASIKARSQASPLEMFLEIKYFPSASVHSAKALVEIISERTILLTNNKNNKISNKPSKHSSKQSSKQSNSRVLVMI